MRLIPAIVQDAKTGKVLMLGYMSPESLRLTRKTGKVTFFSRSRKRLWVKGESSGNYLRARSIELDCDRDALLIQASPAGPTCHTGNISCFSSGKRAAAHFAYAIFEELEEILADRFKRRPKGSYVTSLLEGGLDRIAQKVGEEAVETVIASMAQSKDRLHQEAADLIFHLMVLLRMKGTSLSKVAEVLKKRNRPHRR